MEIVLLWIDDLDDLIHAAAFILIRTRRLCLQVGLAAALILQLATSTTSVDGLAAYLAGAAAACVTAWSLALAADWLVLNRAELRTPA
jgi:hypothetical protein